MQYEQAVHCINGNCRECSFDKLAHIMQQHVLTVFEEERGKLSQDIWRLARWLGWFLAEVCASTFKKVPKKNKKKCGCCFGGSAFLSAAAGVEYWTRTS